MGGVVVGLIEESLCRDAVCARMCVCVCVRARTRAPSGSILSYGSLRRHGLTVVLPGSSIHGISQARILEWVPDPGI